MPWKDYDGDLSSVGPSSELIKKASRPKPKASSVFFYGENLTLVNSFGTKFRVSLPQQCGIAISFETKPFIRLFCELQSLSSKKWVVIQSNNVEKYTEKRNNSLHIRCD